MKSTPGIPTAHLLDAKLPSAQKVLEDPKAIAKAAAEFESLFLNEMFKVMRRTIPKGADSSMASDMFTGMLDSEVAKVTAGNQSGLGIAKMIERQLMQAIGKPTNEGDALGVKPGNHLSHGVSQLRGMHRLASQKASPGLNPLLLDGDWVRPVQGEVGRLRSGQRFGDFRQGLRPEECGDGHCGIDLARVKGTPVQSTSSGVVTRIHRNMKSKAGLWVELSHRGGAITSRYMHLSQIEPGLKIGDRVTTGQKIGEVGNTGTSSHGNHLHFELFERTGDRKRKYLNPGEVFKSWGASNGVSPAQRNQSDTIFPQEKEKLDDVVGARDSHRSCRPNKSFGLAYVKRYKLDKTSGDE